MKKVCIFIVVGILIMMLYAKEEQNNIFMEERKEKIKYGIQEEYDYCIVDQNEIIQWAIDNKGVIPSVFSNINAWEFDDKVATKEIDINYKDFSGECKRKCIVAVIDTGIDIMHKDYTSLWQNTQEIEKDAIDNDGNGYVDDMYGWNFCDNNNIIIGDEYINNIHGTHIVGILIAKGQKFVGVLNNSSCEVMCIKALEGNDNSGDFKDIINAVKYAEENGAKICNLSLATYIESYELRKVIENSKMLFVVSSGNMGVEIDDYCKVYPAYYSLDNVISVADFRCDGKISRTSNYGEVVDVAAPGTDIVSTFPKDEYGYLSGTSCATPYVSGLAAMVYSCSKTELKAEEIKELICNNVTRTEKIADKIKSGGIINYENTLLECIK